jgi:exodeoxyribonuclease V alpha subunit
MKSDRSWFQISPRGTARERYVRLARMLGLAVPATAGPEPDERPDSIGADDDPGPHEHDDGLDELFRNVAAGAQAHDLGDESLYLAQELAELQWSLGSREKRAVAILVLATMISVRQGSSRLPLSRQPESYLGRLVHSLVRAGKLDLEADALLGDIDELTRQSLDRVIGRGDDYRPLILADGCIYQHRMFWCENQLAARLRARLETAAGTAEAGAGMPRAPDGALDASLDRALDRALADVRERPAVVGDAAVRLSAEQEQAVRAAVGRRFTVISGGPGTGKTAIVATMLRVLRRLGETVDALALAAPTGKAAHRMGASIRQALLAVPDRVAVDDELLTGGLEPQTLHRLLGYVPGADRFRHHENNPLRASTVIVDEASMIDLELMERLLRAVPPETRLVLLGDADQLPSVDAGAVLRDLMLAGTDASRGPGSAGFALRLTHSYRMDPRNPAGRAILGAAGAINRGDAATLLGDGPAAGSGSGSGDAASDPNDRSDGDGTQAPGRLAVRTSPAALAWYGIELLDTGGSLDTVHELVDHWHRTRVAAHPEFQRLATRTYAPRDGQWSAEDSADLAALFALYEHSRLLTVTRRQDTGSDAINRRLHRRVLAAASVEHSPDFYPGEPVMMRRNDYERGLFNGDQGVVVRVSENDGQQRFRLVFARSDGFAVFPIDALRMHVELAFAMTVHKSQGSEFDEVALILPGEEIPLATREMLYTGVTRARRAVVLVGAPALVAAATARPGERFSGLADQLVGPAPRTRAGLPAPGSRA